jgi:HlyD family secretion protein
MTTLQKSLIAVGAVVVVGGIIGASVLSRPKEKGEEVYMAKVAVKDLASFVSATGRIEARTKVNVQSSVIGEIVGLPVKEGDVVGKGDLLVQIDPERYRTEVDRLQSAVRMQKIAIEQAEVALANAERQHRRNTALFGTSGLVSQETLDRSELDQRQREIDVQSLKEQVQQADASLARARDDLSKTTIRSPIDGTVTKLNAEKGEITLTGTMNNAGTVIMIVSDMGEILATVDVDETRVTQVKLGQTARVVVDAVGEAKPYTGKVVEIAGSAVQRTGQQTQVFEVKIALDTVDTKLRPGMTAKARVETERLDHATAIPIQAVMLRPTKDLEVALAGDGKKDEAAKAAEKDEKKDAVTPVPSTEAKNAKSGKTAETKECVFVVESGKAKLRAVTSGLSDETSVAVLEGLKDGETVVTGPYRALRDLKNGDAVREKKAEESKSDTSGGKAKVEID